jgi:hypothetical protein
MDMQQLSAEKSQEVVQASEHVPVSGFVKGDCAGQIRVDAIDTDQLGGPKEGGEISGPITTLNLDAPGEFTILVPKGSSIQLTALCDGNRDGKITESDDKLSMGSRIGKVDEATGGVELALEDIRPPGTDGGPGAGGPGAEEKE